MNLPGLKPEVSARTIYKQIYKMRLLYIVKLHRLIAQHPELVEGQRWLSAEWVNCSLFACPPSRKFGSRRVSGNLGFVYWNLYIRQVTFAHQRGINGIRGSSAFSNRPNDQGLPAPNIAGRKDVLYRTHKTSVSLYIAALVTNNP